MDMVQKSDTPKKMQPKLRTEHFSGSCPVRALLLAAALLLTFVRPASAQETPETGTEETRETALLQETVSPNEVSQTEVQPDTDDSTRTEEPSDIEDAGSEDKVGAVENPCAVEQSVDEPRLDKFRREVFERVCESAFWFDGFFGSQRFDEEARRTRGRIGARVIYDEFGGVEFDGDLKVRVDLPNLEHRMNAFLGREDQQDFLGGRERQLDFIPTFFQREGEQDWLLGLGYRPGGLSKRSALDFDVGIDVGSPIDPFVRAQYRYLWPVGNEGLLRARQSLYWTNERGVGTGTRVDYEKPTGSRTLVRVVGNVIHDDVTEGLDWETGATLYHGFTNDHAISWFVGIDGETGRDVPIEIYGTRFTYRQRMLRDWFFGELITGVTWPKDDPLLDREMAWHFGFGFEIAFSGEDLGIGR